MAHSDKVTGAALTAKAAGLVACRHCGAVWPEGTTRCGRCGSPVSSRFPQSLQRVWAWWTAGIVAYIPANLFPMMSTDVLGSATASTIIGGVIDLIHHDAAFVALVVFLASVCIPVGKFIAIAWIALTLRRPPDQIPAHRLHRVHEVVEFIGRWSMIDVFVVAILSALVQISVVLSINPGIAAISFALSVGFTMLSAQSLDPRLIYDASDEGRHE